MTRSAPVSTSTAMSFVGPGGGAGGVALEDDRLAIW